MDLIKITYRPRNTSITGFVHRQLNQSNTLNETAINISSNIYGRTPDHSFTVKKKVKKAHVSLLIKHGYFMYVPFFYYLTQHHSCKDSLEVCEVMVAELGYDAGVQQHQLERTRVWSDTDHHSVPQVSEGRFTLGLPCGTSTVTGTSKRPSTLDQDVPGMEVPMNKVIHKYLKHRRTNGIDRDTK